ncbi:hypothetical protein SALBM311S_04757 [Streptomyces alboniger]
MTVDALTDIAGRSCFRPEEYWKAGSKVTMKIDLDGVEGADGVQGVQKKTVSFTIGVNRCPRST